MYIRLILSRCMNIAFLPTLDAPSPLEIRAAIPKQAKVLHENAISVITLAPTLALSFLTSSLRLIDNSLRNMAERSLT